MANETPRKMSVPSDPMPSFFMMDNNPQGVNIDWEAGENDGEAPNIGPAMGSHITHRKNDVTCKPGDITTTQGY